VRGINCRGLRLKLVAGLTIALLMPTLAVVAAHAQASTTTTLTAGTLSGCSQPLTVAVSSGTSAITSGGTVTIEDEFNGSQVQLASVALSATGTASPTVSLAEGSHSLTAVFTGNATYLTSTSSPVAASVATQCEFTVALSNFIPATTAANTLILTPGQSGTATVTVSPSIEFTSLLTAPMSVTLSCAGLPDNASCSFTPENVEILSTTTTAPTSTMVIQTQAASTTSASPSNRPGRRSTPIAWAFLLPGALGLGGLAWGARRRRGVRGTVSRWLSRFSLLMLVGLVTLLGTTACNPRYDYLNHGPSTNSATPAGTYNVTVTGVYNNGNTATTHSSTFVLTVN
jgi:hypothetical protein